MPLVNKMCAFISCEGGPTWMVHGSHKSTENHLAYHLGAYREQRNFEFNEL